jgi:hypothetical protein
VSLPGIVLAVLSVWSNETHSFLILKQILNLLLCAYKVIRGVLSDSEEGASPFEILHSGLVPQLLR